MSRDRDPIGRRTDLMPKPREMTWITLNEHILRYDELMGIYMRTTENGQFCLTALLKTGELTISAGMESDEAEATLGRARTDLEIYEFQRPSNFTLKEAILEVTNWLETHK